MTTNFDIYNPLKEWKKGDYPVSPEVYIKLRSYRTNVAGVITISPAMASDMEVDITIDSLIDDLEKIRNKAKKELKSTLQKQL